tara:strand:+ start:9618 stop:9791 length:174 start_codon:yes stop_codon:yes gene_type:complete
MSFREDFTFEIFVYVMSSETINKTWSEEMEKIKSETKYIEPYELYCLAYEKTKNKIN